MKSRIMCFAPGRASPGMTLATAVSDRDGHTTLLTEGSVLDEEMLARYRVGSRAGQPQRRRNCRRAAHRFGAG